MPSGTIPSVDDVDTSTPCATNLSSHDTTRSKSLTRLSPVPTPCSGLGDAADTEDPSLDIPDYIAGDEKALEACLHEKLKPYRQALRSSAVGWSILFTLAIVGEGYDLALMGNFFSLGPFQRLFGREPEPGKHPEIPALWQSSIQAATLAGQILAVYLSGLALDRYGFRKTVMTALGMVMVFLLVNFFSPEALALGGSDAGLGMLLCGEFLLGIPWGVFQATTVPYASEVAPEKLRPALTTLVNACWIFGQLGSTAANKLVIGFKDELLAFRLPVAVQWVWPVPVAIAVFFAPESPWWLVRHDRPKQALASIKRLGSKKHAEGALRIIELTTEHEEKPTIRARIEGGETPQDHGRDGNGGDSSDGTLVGGLPLERSKEETDQSLQPFRANTASSRSSGPPPYRECFKHTNVRRTEIVVMLNLTQQLCGSCLMYYSAKLYQKAGIEADKAFDYTLIQYGLGLVAIATSWLLMARFRRRTLWLTGLGASAIIMASVGILGSFVKGADSGDGHNEWGPDPAAAALTWAIAALLIVFTIAYNLSVGALTYSLVGEMPSTRLKAKTVVVGRAAYLIAGFANLFLVPKMLEDKPNGWGLGPRAALLFAGLDVVFWLWAFFRLPETKGRSFAEIDVLFKQERPPRSWG